MSYNKDEVRQSALLGFFPEQIVTGESDLEAQVRNIEPRII